MSDLAIAATTATLRILLEKALVDLGTGTVSTLPLDKAFLQTGNRLNLFLYNTAPNAAWRNQPIPNKVKPGERGRPPLALDLFYLITAYGDDPAQEDDHRLLGAAMRMLHDHAELLPEDIHNAVGPTSLSRANLDRQFERVRLTLDPLSIEDMSKLWSTFQTQYRISVAYQASVVLLESSKPAVVPLPVLTRGENDIGPDVIPNMPAQLFGVEYRDPTTRRPALPAGLLGETVAVVGERMPASDRAVLVLDPRKRPTPADPAADVIARLAPLEGSTPEAMLVKLDAAADPWLCGPLWAVIEQSRPGRRPQRTNRVPLNIAPNLVAGGSINWFTVIEDGHRHLVLACDPPIPSIDAQRLVETMLILTPLASGRSYTIPVKQPSPNLTPTTPVFDIQEVPPGRYRVRLRVESVDSLVIRRDATGLTIEIDDRQEVQL